MCELPPYDVTDPLIRWIADGLALIPDLTEREREVFEYLAHDPSNEQIARHLGMAERTVKFHVANLRAKLGGLSRIRVSVLAVCHHVMARGPGCAPDPRSS
ncbi:LuxR C-terminal-related transcriptional regulator [Streptomyces sp. BI20]|uniref:LuxR C-terminal-related transcriptional regulator n=1 Tax=Streptomyces sp. BI20 TaxID=3403460 RepID=UPI003C72757F